MALRWAPKWGLFCVLSTGMRSASLNESAIQPAHAPDSCRRDALSEEPDALLCVAAGKFLSRLSTRGIDASHRAIHRTPTFAVAGLRPGFMALNQRLLLLRRDRSTLGFCQDALAKNRNSKQTQQQQATAVTTDGRLHAETIQLKAL